MHECIFNRFDEHERSCCRCNGSSPCVVMISIDGFDRIESIKLHTNSFLSEFMNSKSSEIVCQGDDVSAHRDKFIWPFQLRTIVSICIYRTQQQQMRHLLADAKHHEIPSHCPMHRRHEDNAPTKISLPSSTSVPLTERRVSHSRPIHTI